MYRNSENFLVLNPKVWLTVADAKATGALMLAPIELWFDIAFTPLFGSPIEYQAMWSFDKPTHYCQSLGTFMDVFNFTINMTTKVYECDIGFGAIYYGYS